MVLIIRTPLQQADDASREATARLEAVVLKRLAPGIYDDGRGSCHLDLWELLRAAGYPDTPEHRETLRQVAEAIGRERGLRTIVITMDIGEDAAWDRRTASRESDRGRA